MKNGNGLRDDIVLLFDLKTVIYEIINLRLSRETNIINCGCG